MRIQLYSCRRPRVVGVASELSVAIALALTAASAQSQENPEQIVVTATPHGQSVDELAQSVSVVTGLELDRIRAANLGETLESQLGMSASYFGTGSSRPIIRGLAGPRVRTMEDGIDSMDASTVSVDHAVSIDPLAAQQVEIFRGPTTLLYGSGAVGGIVNTVTNRIPVALPEDGIDGAIELQGNTVADDRALSLAVDGGGEALAWHFDGMTRETDDYEIPGAAHVEHEEPEPPEEGHEEAFGFVENSDIEVDAAAAGLSWIGDGAQFGVSVSSFDSNYGLPGHEHEEQEPVPPVEEEHPPVRIDLAQTRIDLKGGWMGMSGAFEAINLRLGVNDYEHVELEGDEIGTRFDNDAWEGRLELLHSPWGAWNGAFGLQLSEREFAAQGEEAFVPPVDTSSYGVFLIEQRETGSWQLSLGGRIETQEHKPSNGLPVVDDSATSLSLAAIRELGDSYALAFNLADAERLPVAEELYSDGPHLATGTIQIGDPGLGVEGSRHLDIGFRKTEGDLTWAITGFMTDYDGFIYLADTGVVDPDELLPVFQFVQNDAEFVGLEAELFTPIAQVGTGEIDIRIFADFVEGDLAAGGHLPQMPPRRLGARLQYHNDRIMTGIETSAYDDQDRIAEYETPTEGYTMLNADLQWTLGADRGTRYELFLRGTNLLDEDARRHASFLKDELPLPGRNYSVGFRTRF
jgi:iron complex outermembrane receptor protein